MQPICSARLTYKLNLGLNSICWIFLSDLTTIKASFNFCSSHDPAYLTSILSPFFKNVQNLVCFWSDFPLVSL